MRVVWISLITVAFVILGLFGIRTWSLAAPIVRFQHAFWTSERPYLAVRVKTMAEARAIEDPKVIFWLDVRTTRDHKFFVLPPQDLTRVLTPEKIGAEKYYGPQNYHYTLEDLRPFFPDAPTLEDILKTFPERRVILNVVDNATGIHEDLVKVLEPLKPDERILIQSDTDNILRSIKDLKPLWIYGTSFADVMRLLSFDSVWLGPATPFRGDAFITPVKIRNRAVLEASVFSELHRREKNTFIGPIEDESEFEAARAFHPDGYIFASPDLLRQLRAKATP